MFGQWISKCDVQLVPRDEIARGSILAFDVRHQKPAGANVAAVVGRLPWGGADAMVPLGAGPEQKGPGSVI